MITSVANQQIKNLMKLGRRSKIRREQDVFLIEGEKMFQEVPENLLKHIYVSHTYYEKNKTELEKRQCSFEIVEDSVFQTVSDTMTPQGVLCVVRQLHYSMDVLWKETQPLFLLLEDLQDPGNLGTILRTSEAAGVTAVIMNRGCVDIFNPKTIRSTMGAIFRLPFLYTDNLLEMVERIKQKQIPVYAAHLQDSVEYDKYSYKKGTAFLIGNEGNGLSEMLSQAASGYIKIPMLGKVESLNAAVAASILVYEAYRQRR